MTYYILNFVSNGYEFDEQTKNEYLLDSPNRKLAVIILNVMLNKWNFGVMPDFIINFLHKPRVVMPFCA